MLSPALSQEPKGHVLKDHWEMGRNAAGDSEALLGTCKCGSEAGVMLLLALVPSSKDTEWESRSPGISGA